VFPPLGQSKSSVRSENRQPLLCSWAAGAGQIELSQPALAAGSGACGGRRAAAAARRGLHRPELSTGTPVFHRTPRTGENIDRTGGKAKTGTSERWSNGTSLAPPTRWKKKNDRLKSARRTPRPCRGLRRGAPSAISCAAASRDGAGERPRGCQHPRDAVRIPLAASCCWDAPRVEPRGELAQ
jgi:hypothetical protein